MAQDATHSTAESAADDQIDVQVWYTVYDSDHEGFEQARDIRTFADPSEIDRETFEIAYKRVADVTLDLSETDILSDDRGTIFGHIFSRLQGGRVDDDLDYDGSEQRSMMIGDVIAVDGRAALVGEGCSFPDLGELEYLHPAAADSTPDYTPVQSFAATISGKLALDARAVPAEDAVEVLATEACIEDNADRLQSEGFDATVDRDHDPTRLLIKPSESDLPDTY